MRGDQGQLMEKPQKLPGRKWSMRKYLSSIDRQRYEGSGGKEEFTDGQCRSGLRRPS